MNNLKTGGWVRKSGQTYLQKFAEMTASARKFDNSASDRNPAKDEVVFRSDNEEASISLGDSPKVALKSFTEEIDHRYDKKETSTRSVVMSAQDDTLVVTEQNVGKLYDTTYHPSYPEPRQTAEGSWSRSFLVDMQSGLILTDKPEIGNLVF